MSLKTRTIEKRETEVKKMKTVLIGTKTILKRSKNNSEKQKKRFCEAKPVLRSKNGSEK